MWVRWGSLQTAESPGYLDILWMMIVYYIPETGEAMPMCILKGGFGPAAPTQLYDFIFLPFLVKHHHWPYTLLPCPPHRSPEWIFNPSKLHSEPVSHSRFISTLLMQFLLKKFKQREKQMLALPGKNNSNFIYMLSLGPTFINSEWYGKCNKHDSENQIINITHDSSYNGWKNISQIKGLLLNCSNTVTLKMAYLSF